MVYLKNIIILLLFFSYLEVNTYIISNHPCCQDTPENITLALIIDAFEIYGHDPTDKLDHFAHYHMQMLKVKRAEDQYIINELVHIATDHLNKFIYLHVKELKVLLIALDDAIDNMLTMYEMHNSLRIDRASSYYLAAGNIPMEFYMSQEYYCGKNVYIFTSELYSDIYYMGRGIWPYCKGRSFHFLGFVHFVGEDKYFLEEDPNVVFEMDNFIHGLECHLGICIYRFPFKKGMQHTRDVVMLPKAIVKCGLVMYKLPPLTATSCIISSGSFIFDFNIQGIRYRHYDYLLWVPNGATFYTKEKENSPLTCDHHVCEWTYINHYGGPFIVPGEPSSGVPPSLVFVEPTTTEASASTPPSLSSGLPNVTYNLDGCWFMFPPNYGSIAGISYLDPLSVNEDRFTCTGPHKGLYWYPQWMGIPPEHPYHTMVDTVPQEMDPRAPFYPHNPGAGNQKLMDRMGQP